MVLFACCTGRVQGDEEVLWWMVDSSAKVDGVDIQDFIEYPASDGSYYAARVRVLGEGVAENTFLNLYEYDDVTGEYSTYDGSIGVEFSDAGGYWGAGVPEPGMPTDIGEYAGNSPEYSFMIEIGNIVDAKWTTVATSEASKYTDLAAHISTGVMGIPEFSAWNPVSYTSSIPEPSSGLLILLGGCFLALRRGKMV